VETPKILILILRGLYANVNVID